MNPRYLSFGLLTAVSILGLTSCNSEVKSALHSAKNQSSETSDVAVVQPPKVAIEETKTVVSIEPRILSQELASQQQDVPGQLKRLLTIYDPKTEVFKVDPSIENSFETENGTQFYFQPNSFVQSNGQPITGVVEISVKAYNNNPAFLSGNLTTKTTNGSLLETGGMVYIKATAGSGADLQLADGKPARISFQCQTDPVADMHTFYGDVDTQGNMLWNEDLASIQIPLSKVAPAAAWKRKNHAFHPRVAKYTDQVNGTKLEWVRKDQDSCYLDWLEDIEIDWTPVGNYFLSTSHHLDMQVTFDSEGKMKTLKAVNEITQEQADQLLTIFRNAPAIDMSTMGEGAVNRVFEITIHGSKRNDETLLRNRWQKVIDADNKRKQEFADSMQVVHEQNTQKMLLFKDSTAKAEQALLEKISTQRNEEIDEISVDDLNKYVIVATKLGWVNCDSFSGTKESRKVDLLVDFDPNYETGKIVIVFENLRAMMYATKTEDGWLVEGIPIGEPIRLVSIAFEGEHPLLANESLVLLTPEVRRLTYTSFSYDDLEKALSPQPKKRRA